MNSTKPTPVGEMLLRLYELNSITLSPDKKEFVSKLKSWGWEGYDGKRTIIADYSERFSKEKVKITTIVEERQSTVGYLPPIEAADYWRKFVNNK
jgi:hypothetical protein